MNKMINNYKLISKKFNRKIEKKKEFPNKLWYKINQNSLDQYRKLDQNLMSYRKGQVLEAK